MISHCLHVFAKIASHSSSILFYKRKGECVVSNYVYQSDQPDTPSDSGNVSHERKENRKHSRSRFLYVCLFVVVAVLTFTSILFLSGFISIDKDSGSFPAGSSAVQIMGPQY